MTFTTGTVFSSLIPLLMSSTAWATTTVGVGNSASTGTDGSDLPVVTFSDRDSFDPIEAVEDLYEEIASVSLLDGQYITIDAVFVDEVPFSDISNMIATDVLGETQPDISVRANLVTVNINEESPLRMMSLNEVPAAADEWDTFSETSLRDVFGLNTRDAAGATAFLFQVQIDGVMGEFVSYPIIYVEAQIEGEEMSMLLEPVMSEAWLAMELEGESLWWNGYTCLDDEVCTAMIPSEGAVTLDENELDTFEMDVTAGMDLLYEDDTELCECTPYSESQQFDDHAVSCTGHGTLSSAEDESYKFHYGHHFLKGTAHKTCSVTEEEECMVNASIRWAEVEAGDTGGVGGLAEYTFIHSTEIRDYQVTVTKEARCEPVELSHKVVAYINEEPRGLAKAVYFVSTLWGKTLYKLGAKAVAPLDSVTVDHLEIDATVECGLDAMAENTDVSEPQTGTGTESDPVCGTH